ncbi:MAG: hypothetical protein AAGD25_31720 [Cyanobacteria bacterium P01_F01_bin.150]
MQAPIKLLIPFDALAEAIALLDKADQMRLRHPLDEHINSTSPTLESQLLERGGQTPLKECLEPTSVPFEKLRPI